MLVSKLTYVYTCKLVGVGNQQKSVQERGKPCLFLSDCGHLESWVSQVFGIRIRENSDRDLDIGKQHCNHSIAHTF